MSDDPLLKVPFSERRGCWLEDCGNNWEAVLLAGDIDTVSTRLEKGELIGLVKRDVTEQVLAGECPVPDGKWALLVKLVGTDWVHLADPSILNPFTRDLQIAESLASDSGLRVLQTGYQKTACATYVMLHTEGEDYLNFESTGAGFRTDSHDDQASDDEDCEYDYDDEFDVTMLESKQYPENWWQQFDSEEQAQQALLRDMNAYIPFLQAYPEDEVIQLAACHEDAVLPKHIERIDLAVFGTNASADPNPTSRRLVDAIETGDLTGVESALSDGADLIALPGIICSPLVYAIQQLQSDRKDGARIVSALIASGAMANEQGQSKNSPLVEAVKQVKQCPDQATEAINALLDAGADINRQGEITFLGGGTPLHEAVQAQSLAAIMLLHSREADVTACDMTGNTPLDRATGMLQSVRQHLEGTSEDRIAQPIESIVYYLTLAVQGEAAGDWEVQIKQDRTRFESERRRMLVAGEKFKRGMEGLGERLAAFVDE